jgi:hypothetical protein
VDTFGQNRSIPLIAAVLIALAIGLGCLYSLPVVTEHDDYFDETYNTSYNDLDWAMYFTGYSWLRPLTLIGVAVAAVSAVGFTNSKRNLRALLITIGSIAAMGGPIWVLAALHDVGGGVENLGIGVIIAMVGFAVAALAPWVLGREAQPQLATR